MCARVLIAGPWSGSGKTTVTLALLAALRARGLELSAAKCGPDYVDPQFHREVMGISSRNLDPYFLDREGLCAALAQTDGDLTLIEGVMGYYDGVGPDGLYSTYQLAVQTQTPVVLVVPARGMYQSLQALISGYKNFRPDSQIRGVIFNQAAPHLAAQLADFAASQGLESLGVLPYAAENFIQAGPLGLDLEGDKAALTRQIQRLGQLAEKYLDLDKVLALADQAPCLEAYLPGNQGSGSAQVRREGEGNSLPRQGGAQQAQTTARQTCVLAVARDPAFTKIYPENIQVLEEAGFQVQYFSPLSARDLPADTGALYLPGGCPEKFAADLAANQTLRARIRQALNQGLPCWAEQGGTAYLCQTLGGQPMVGYLQAKVELADRLQNFGYGSLTALRDNPLCPTGASLKCHEFHYYQTRAAGQGLERRRTSGSLVSAAGWAEDRLFASFAQLYLPAYPQVARSFYQLATAGRGDQKER